MNTIHIDAPEINNSSIVAAPALLRNAVYELPLTDTEQVFDYSQNKTQEEFNREVAEVLINKIRMTDGNTDSPLLTNLLLSSVIKDSHYLDSAAPNVAAVIDYVNDKEQSIKDYITYENNAYLELIHNIWAQMGTLQQKINIIETYIGINQTPGGQLVPDDPTQIDTGNASLDNPSIPLP